MDLSLILRCGHFHFIPDVGHGDPAGLCDEYLWRLVLMGLTGLSIDVKLTNLNICYESSYYCCTFTISNGLPSGA